MTSFPKNTGIFESRSGKHLKSHPLTKGVKNAGPKCCLLESVPDNTGILNVNTGITESGYTFEKPTFDKTDMS